MSGLPAKSSFELKAEKHIKKNLSPDSLNSLNSLILAKKEKNCSWKSIIIIMLDLNAFPKKTEELFQSG